jgi:hypothetical protein
VATQKELPGLAEIGRELADRARERPLAAVCVGLATGYLLGGGLFSRPTRWLVRAVLGALAVPSVREQVLAALRELRSGAAEPAASASA